MAWGANKAKIVSKAIEGKVSSKTPCSYLQNHINTTAVLDNDSAKELTRIKTPWRVDLCEWNENLKFKAVMWLSDKTNKPVLKLEDEDYNKYGMSDLINSENNAYDLNIKIFDRVQRMITGWPGGKPNVEKERYPERSSPSSKRCLIFSPHPDDDVISMGGTLDRLISQGHEVHVVYQTSGNIAVPDHEALKFIEVCEGLSIDIPKKIKKLKKRLKERNISPQDENLLLLKGNIRKSEAFAAVRFLNLNENNIHFLNLPFYETGKIKKNPVSEIDISLTVELINKIKPHQIFAAGDLADPHGTHKKCFEVILESLKKIKNQPYSKNCWLWLYRGAWLDWEIHEANMAIPMSPSQVLRKRSAIFFHQTQKDGVMFQGEDRREFWLRAEERNRNNAQKLKNLGMTNYEAVELYKRYLY
jgi:glucosamine-6-phosphate deaminase